MLLINVTFKNLELKPLDTLLVSLLRSCTPFRKQWKILFLGSNTSSKRFYSIFLGKDLTNEIVGFVQTGQFNYEKMSMQGGRIEKSSSLSKLLSILFGCNNVNTVKHA